MRIEVHQLPPPECSPNWRGFWAGRYRPSRIYQVAVFCCCVDIRNRLQRLPWQRGFPPFQKAQLDLTFIFSTARRRDIDNLLGRFKPGLDGIIQAGLVIDDDMNHVTFGQVQVLVDKGRAPLTIIELKEVET